MFFAPLAGRLWGFATHPSLDERIAAVQPGFDRADYRERHHGVRREIAVVGDGGDVVGYLPLDERAVGRRQR
jgi:hypothetical protein